MDLREMGLSLKAARKAKGLTQSDLAKACDMSRATVNALEAGKIKELGFSRILKLGKHVGLEIRVSYRGATKGAGAPASEILKSLEKKYVWWTLPQAENTDERVIAQVMDIGTFEDAKALEAEVGQLRMRQVLSGAQAGWFSPKSWNYWHFVLDLAPSGKAPPLPRRAERS